MTQQTHTKKLKDFAELKSGNGFPKEYQNFEKGEYGFYKVGDISRTWLSGNTYLLEPEYEIPERIVEKIKGTIFPKDSIVFAKIGEALKLNRRAITYSPCLVDNNVFVLIPDKNKVLSKFLFYFTLTMDLSNLSRATTVPSLRKQDVEEISFPNFSLSEQTLIVQEIEKQFTRLDTAVKSLKSVKQKLEVYRKAVLKKAFEKKDGWEESFIGKEAKVKYGKGLPERERKEGEVPVYGSAGEVGHHNTYLIDFPTIIVARKGSIGNNFIIKSPCWAIDTVYYLEDIKINLDYLYHFLNSSIFKDTSTAVPSLRRNDLEKIKIDFPKSKEEQTLIVQSIESKFSVIDKVEQIVEESLKKSEKLRKSILKSAFEGKLVKMNEVEE